MTVSVTFSKPAKDCAERLGRPYVKVRVWRRPAAALLPPAGRGKRGPAAVYDAELFTGTQSFRRTFTEGELEAFKREHAGRTFRCVVERTEGEEITTLANRRGEARTFSRPLPSAAAPSFAASADRKKRYIIEEGKSVPFLVRLGVMSAEGKVVAQKYDKFRQINRFLEYIDDLLPALGAASGGFSAERPLRVVDFGCGKSYLTFAVYHFLHGLRGIPVDITGLDLKEDVIAGCRSLAEESGCTGLRFLVGDIADYADSRMPDLVMTLHACDTATDYALDWAIGRGAAAILCVPCCQHELNGRLQKAAGRPAGGAAGLDEGPFSPLLRYGLVRERFAALATDAVRAELLEQSGYQVQVLEFIDMSRTPKNLLLRAVRKRGADLSSADGQAAMDRARGRKAALLAALGVGQELDRLLAGRRAALKEP